MAAGLTTRRSALKFAGLIALASQGWRGSPGQAATMPVRGYGSDPNLLKRTVPWPRTLSAQQLKILRDLCDIVLPVEPPYPSAGTIGVHEFMDEWVSAPYPQMQADRAVILNGLAALDDAVRKEAGVSFADANLAQRTAIFDHACAGAETAGFARRLIELVCDGYYTTREGHAAIGYIGNVPLADYPEPSPEIVRHFELALSELQRVPMNS